MGCEVSMCLWNKGWRVNRDSIHKLIMGGLAPGPETTSPSPGREPLCDLTARRPRHRLPLTSDLSITGVRDEKMVFRYIPKNFAVFSAFSIRRQKFKNKRKNPGGQIRRRILVYLRVNIEFGARAESNLQIRDNIGACVCDKDAVVSQTLC